MANLVVVAQQVCKHPNEAKNPKRGKNTQKNYPEKTWGKWKWQIGSHDSMGGMFSCFFVEAESAERKFSSVKNGKRVTNNCYESWNAYTGVLFDTKKEALDAGAKARPKVVQDVANQKAKRLAEIKS